MEVKKCSKCNVEKPVEDFLWKNKSKNQRHYSCKECYKELRKASYDKNAQYYRDKSKRRRKEHSIQYEEYKKSLFCKMCGETESVCLDFHHLNSDSKQFTIGSRKYSSGNFQKTINEIKKCVVLCANCHRKVHAGIIRLDGVMD
jgi:hypothetical protein